MSPRRGGEADKLGNHYEGAWIVLHILEVLAGRADSITIEELGDIGKGVEFTLRRFATTEVHQVKRQRGSANYWTLGDLRSEGVLDAARRHVAEGRQFHFVSTVPAQELQDLAEQARHSPDVQTFVNTLAANSGIAQRFNYLSSTVYGSAQVAWETLRGTWGRWPGEREIRNWNSAFAGLLLSGAPAPTAAVTLADLAIENLSATLTKQVVGDRLAEYELTLAPVGDPQPLARKIAEMCASWKSSIERELVRPSISRTETEEVMSCLVGDERCAFAVGAGGSGKSAVLHGVVELAESEGWPVLALRLDREEPFSSTFELGQRFGLPASPVSGLARIAQERPSLLVVDQLDAVSKASGRMPQTFDIVADLVREASAFPAMRVVLACRKFDLDNDDRIRTLIQDRQAKEILIAELSEDQVVDAVEAMGVPPHRLSIRQRGLLRLPLHLKLLATIVDQADAFSFTTEKDLFDAYWERKRRDCRVRRGAPVRFAEVVAALADEMSNRRRLAVPVTILDDMDLHDDADVLASEYVLIRDGQQVAFFHEAFFDYAFSRRWMRRGQSLVEFLLAGEQELFRRGQVRQILTYLREEDSERFVTEMESVLEEPRVRFHLKHVALGLLSALPEPTPAEWSMVERLLAQELPFAERLWLALRSLPWFERLDAEGVLEGWLRGTDSELQHRALDVMALGGKDRPDRLAAMLAPHAGRAEHYPAWLRWIARFAPVQQSRALFELILAAVVRGEYGGHEQELFMSVHDLGKSQPEWAVELLVAYLADRPDAMALDSSTRVSALLVRDHGAIELTTAAAANAPESFSQKLVPYMLKVMALTAYDRDDGPILDRHFTHQIPELPHHEIEEALAAGAINALRAFVVQKPDVAKPLLDQLAADPHDAAQRLLYEALIAAGGAYAEYAVELLLDRGAGLGAVESWTTRCVIQAISSHLTSESFARLERAVVEFRPGWDGRPPGRASFTWLSAMDEARLSEVGRRRLAELRRLFNQEQPTAPKLLAGGFLGSPIPQAAAQRMSDDQWLRAMAKYNADREDWTKFRGDARELSQVLREEVKKEPGRFARLALRIGPDAHSAYIDAILMGLGDSEAPVDPDLVFQAMRHIVSLGDRANDRWLGWALRKHLRTEIPYDLINALIDRALHSADPTDDSLLPESGDEESSRRDNLLEEGMNTARGQAVEILGDIIIYDPDGRRTALVLPSLNELAGDSSLAVRACTAHLIAACLRHARPEAIAAFHLLIQADDRLLVTRYIESLIVYLGNSDAGVVKPVIQRMLSSTQEKVREAGGRLAAYAGLELGDEELLTSARSSADPAVRKGVAVVCAGRLPHTANAAVAGAALRRFVNDADEEVRKAAAGLATALRDRAIRSFEQELTALIDSPAFSVAASQLLITLDHAPDRVDHLILRCARRFVEVYGMEAGDISTHAASEAREVGELLMRAYAQAVDTKSRGAVLDLLDALLAAGAYGVSELVDATDR